MCGAIICSWPRSTSAPPRTTVSNEFSNGLLLLILFLLFLNVRVFIYRCHWRRQCPLRVEILKSQYSSYHFLDLLIHLCHYGTRMSSVLRLCETVTPVVISSMRVTSSVRRLVTFLGPFISLLPFRPNQLCCKTYPIWASSSLLLLHEAWI